MTKSTMVGARWRDRRRTLSIGLAAVAVLSAAAVPQKATGGTRFHAKRSAQVAWRAEGPATALLADAPYVFVQSIASYSSPSSGDGVVIDDRTGKRTPLDPPEDLPAERNWWRLACVHVRPGGYRRRSCCST